MMHLDPLADGTDQQEVVVSARRGSRYLQSQIARP